MALTFSYKETCLLNNNYRALLSKNRTYAGFRQTNKDSDYKLAMDYVKKLISLPNNIRDILDPMAGYGTTMKYCDELGANSYQVELNFPAYLWQLIIHPENKETLFKIIHNIINQKSKFLKTNKIQESSSDWFGQIGLNILTRLFEINMNSSLKECASYENAEQLALALLLPFVMRLSTASKSDYAHIKHSGVALIGDYENDYNYYLSCLPDFISGAANQTKHNEAFKHECHYGDAITFNFPKKRFTGMLTSPPYPNYVDYKKMFVVENAFINLLQQKGCLKTKLIDANTIGSNTVSGTKHKNVSSPMVNSFLRQLSKIKLNKKSKYDMDVYYIPYFISYFSDMELAYENVAKSLADDFCGYIIVSNNNIRNIEVPVSDFLIEFWNNKGFNAKSIDRKSVAHLGDKNKNSNGRLMSRHMEHTIEIKRQVNSHRE